MSFPQRTEPKIIHTATDPLGNIVYLTDDTWRHVTEHHPEIKKRGGIPKIGKTIKNPHMIQKNERSAFIYVEQTHANLYFNVITKQEDIPGTRSVATVHFSLKPLKGDTIWLRSK